MPSDSVWEGTPFAGKTCYDLSKIDSTEQSSQVETLCNFLSLGIFSGPSAIEACCFCGGGDHMFQPSCKNMEWNTLEDEGNGLHCEFIDKLQKDDQVSFCEEYGDTSFVKDRLNVTEAVSFLFILKVQ